MAGCNPPLGLGGASPEGGRVVKIQEPGERATRQSTPKDTPESRKLHMHKRRLIQSRGARVQLDCRPGPQLTPPVPVRKLADSGICRGGRPVCSKGDCRARQAAAQPFKVVDGGERRDVDRMARTARGTSGVAHRDGTPPPGCGKEKGRVRTWTARDPQQKSHHVPVEQRFHCRLRCRCGPSQK